MANTYKDRLIAGLQSKGWKQDIRDKSKYTAFTRQGDNHKLFVGESGALRSGECASRSHSIGRPTTQTDAYKIYLDAGDRALDGSVATKSEKYV